MTKLLILLSTALSLVSCSSVPRPDTNVGVVNSPAKHVKYYNLRDDYDDEGNLKPDAVAKFRPADTVDDLNKNVCTDPQGWANLKTYIKELRDEAARQLKACQSQ